MVTVCEMHELYTTRCSRRGAGSDILQYSDQGLRQAERRQCCSTTPGGSQTGLASSRHLHIQFRHQRMRAQLALGGMPQLVKQR